MAVLDDLSGFEFEDVTEEVVVGHAVYTLGDATRPELAVFVDPALHGRGLATKLCWHVVATAADAGCEALVLHVECDNRAAVRVYAVPENPPAWSPSPVTEEVGPSSAGAVPSAPERSRSAASVNSR